MKIETYKLKVREFLKKNNKFSEINDLTEDLILAISDLYENIYIHKVDIKNSLNEINLILNNQMSMIKDTYVALNLTIYSNHKSLDYALKECKYIQDNLKIPQVYILDGVDDIHNLSTNDFFHILSSNISYQYSAIANQLSTTVLGLMDDEHNVNAKLLGIDVIPEIANELTIQVMFENYLKVTNQNVVENSGLLERLIEKYSNLEDYFTNTKEDEHLYINNLIVDIKKKFNFKVSLSSNVISSLSNDKLCFEHFKNYIDILRENLNALSITYGDNVYDLIKHLPLENSNYFSDKDLAQYCSNIINNKFHSFLTFSPNISNDVSVITHEIQHYRDSIVFFKIYEEFLKENKIYPFENKEKIMFSSQVFFDNLFDELSGKKTNIFESSIQLNNFISIKKKIQNLHIFGSVDFDCEKLKLNKYYESVIEETNYLIAKEFNKIIKNIIYFKLKGKKLEKVKDIIENNKLNNYVELIIKNILSNTITSDIIINNIKNNNINELTKDNIKTEKVMNELRENSSILMLNQDNVNAALVSAISKAFEEGFGIYSKLLNKENIKYKNINSDDLNISYILKLICSQKNILKINKVIKNIDYKDFPKTCLVSVKDGFYRTKMINDKCFEPFLYRMLNQKRLAKEESFFKYLLSLDEILARNTQVFGMKGLLENNFSNKIEIKNRTFFKNALSVTSETIRNMFSQKMLMNKKINNIQDYIAKAYSEAHPFLEEINNQKLNEHSKLQSEIGDVISEIINNPQIIKDFVKDYSYINKECQLANNFDDSVKIQSYIKK